MTSVLLVALAGTAVTLLASGTARRDGASQAAVNAALGFAALLAVHWTGGYTGIRLGLNLFNAAVAGVLGAPGVVLLVLAGWVLG